MENIKANVRMRTIPKAIKEIKDNDPNSCITYTFIKKLCEENKIQYVMSGTRIILNFDSLIKYLYS